MGSNSKQGWYLFVFLIGFAFFPAGLAYLGPLFTLVGLAFLVGSLVGFYSIKQPEKKSQAVASASVTRTKHAI